MAKRTGDQLYKLTIDEKIVRSNVQEIEGLEQDIKQIVEKEGEERDLRKAEMELKKLENVN
jgi:hypothetical protein